MARYKETEMEQGLIIHGNNQLKKDSEIVSKAYAILSIL